MASPPPGPNHNVNRGQEGRKKRCGTRKEECAEIEDGLSDADLHIVVLSPPLLR